MPEPSKIPAAWAWDGDINTIPATDPGNGLASWELGYPIETQTPIAAGGTPPRRQDMNGVLNWLSQYSLWNQQGGLWEYDATEDYEQGNVVIQNNAIYYCKAANGPSGTVKSPSADSTETYWKKLVNADGTLNVPPVVDATTTVKGIVELATSAETKALTDGTRAVTPSSLNGLLSLSPVALTVPKADSNAKLTGWLDALKGGDGRVNISINGTSPQLQTARTVRVNLASTSTASFDGTTNITPGVTGTLKVANGGTGQTDLDLVVVGKAKQLNTSRTINGTSFNGTANITTATWGTSRTFTVTDADGTNSAAAVSVNGGGNVTLKLPATIKGTLTGNASTATVLKTARTVRTNLASTTAASFDGSANITPGVTGTLPVTNGGTGKTDLDAVTVGKAKALNTARSINGTNFDGTGGITTAKWGTARNITIKDATQTNTGAAVSVDGSAAAALLLPATIKAALNGNADTATKLKTARTINGTPFDGTANITVMESSARSLSQNGYIKFQSGLMIQWGRSQFTTTIGHEVNLPTQFTTAIYAVFATTIYTDQQQVENYNIGWDSVHSTLSKLQFYAGTFGLNDEFSWVAIGK